MLHFSLPDGQRVSVEVRSVLNAGFSGRSDDVVAAHIAELAALGIPAPNVTPCLYPVAPYLATQSGEVLVQHGRTSGEVEWALVITRDDVLLTVASDHTDRDLERHGVGWSKQVAPNVLSHQAWRFAEVAERMDAMTLTAWVRNGEWTEIQNGTCADLQPPKYWLDVMEANNLHVPGTVLMSGTLPMRRGVNQFADAWRGELSDPTTGRTLTAEYHVRRLPDPIA
ncbi:uncharacterized protein DUF2848 [Actinocrispum wychmicini]|uniref:Uncharacterized protein DUF2848 n=1 Tax=Actinocrispum wychmicini TaxID=1213861 RepID=A0A4R2KCS5_9PSEU|nr:uncharacterized protein DUF2848 [Actinocrispum wychmicini]